MQREQTQPEGRGVSPEAPDTSRTHELAGPILRGLLAYPRVLRLYPAGHGRVEAQLAEIETQFAELFEHEQGPLLISVKGAGLLINGARIESLTETTARLAFLLRRRRVRALRLLPGLSRGEIEILAQILGTDHKEILRAGGIDSFLSDKVHPHVEAMIYQFSLGTGSGDGGLGSLAKAKLPTQILEKIEMAVTEPQLAERLETIRNAFVEKLLAAGVTAEIEVGVFDELISNFFARPEWANLPVDKIKEAIDTFMDLLENAVNTMAGGEVDPGCGLKIARFRSVAPPSMAAADEDEAPNRSLTTVEELFRNLTPRDLLETRAEHPDSEESYVNDQAVAYEAVDLVGGLIDSLGGMENLATSFSREMETYPILANALLVVGELMVSAEEEPIYQERRESFMRAMRDPRYPESDIASVRSALARDLPPIEFEEREELIDAIFENAADGVGLTQYLESMGDRPDAVRRILRRMENHDDCFGVLANVLCTPRLDALHGTVGQALVDVARRRPEAFRSWAREDRRTLFRAEVCEPLFQHCAHLLSSIVKEVLQEGTDLERARLIKRLHSEGSGRALRMLVMGLNYGAAPESADLLHALGGFRHPLSVSVLRATVQRANTKGGGQNEAEAAVDALHRMGTEEAWAFLWEIVQKRVCLLPLYRRELRQLAECKLAEGQAV